MIWQIWKCTSELDGKSASVSARARIIAVIPLEAVECAENFTPKADISQFNLQDFGFGKVTTIYEVYRNFPYVALKMFSFSLSIKISSTIALDL